MGRVELAGAARLELVSGVARLRPEEAMFEAMLWGWRAQQTSRGLRDETVGTGSGWSAVHEFTGEYPWGGHPGIWTSGRCLTAESHLAPSTIRAYQGTLRLFTEFLIDGRYGWAAACEEAFGPAARWRSAMSGTPSLI